MNDVLDDINNYNKNRDKKVLIVFDDMIADIEYNKNFKQIIKELFYRARKINVSIVFITQSYFRSLKDAKLNSAHYVLMKIGNKKELKRIAEEKLGHLDYKDFLKMYNYCMEEPYSFMTIDTRPTASVTFKKSFNEPIDLMVHLMMVHLMMVQMMLVQMMMVQIILKKIYNSLLLKHFQLRKNMKETKDELDKIKDDTSKK